MTVYKDTKRGTYYISYYYRDPVTNAPKKKVKRGFKTKRDASTYEREVFVKENNKEVGEVNETQLTFVQIVRLWEEYNQASAFPETDRE